MKPAKPLQEGIKSKVIAAFLLSCVAIIAALVIVNYSFQGLLSTVDELTVPNKKLQTLNVLFQQITQLDRSEKFTCMAPAKSRKLSMAPISTSVKSKSFISFNNLSVVSGKKLKPVKRIIMETTMAISIMPMVDGNLK